MNRVQSLCVCFQITRHFSGVVEFYNKTSLILNFTVYNFLDHNKDQIKQRLSRVFINDTILQLHYDFVPLITVFMFSSVLVVILVMYFYNCVIITPDECRVNT